MSWRNSRTEHPREGSEFAACGQVPQSKRPVERAREHTPPVRPLDRFQTRVVGDTVEVGPRYSVTNSLEPVRARDPGEFTGGVWEYLYPPLPSTAPAP